MDDHLFHVIPAVWTDRILDGTYGPQDCNTSAEEWVWGPCEQCPDWDDLCGKLERGEPVKGSPVFSRFVYCD